MALQKGTAAVLGLLLLLVGSLGATPPQQPHLILIVADDLGWNDVSWNNPIVGSPNLAKLASEGIVLDRSYVQPICTPSRSALLTSKYPFTIGRQGKVIGALTPTGLTLNATILPQELKNLGYDTHAVGKWHLGFCKWDYTPTFRGFDSFYGYYLAYESYYTHLSSYAYTGTPSEPTPAFGTGYDFRDNTSVNRATNGTYSAFLYSDRVDLLLSSRSPEKPLFLYVPFQSVHTPLEVPQNYTDIFTDISNRNRRTYLGMVRAMDDAVGRIVASLKRTGHYNNSVIVFTTDNGGPTIDDGPNNWPLRGNKTTLWEGGTRGAAFIHSPLLISPGTVSNRLIHITDWYPTFVHLAGGEAPDDIDGVNQWEALNNQSLPDARDYFVYDIDQTDGMSAAIRWDRYKLLVGDPGPGEWVPPPELQGARGGTTSHMRSAGRAVLSENDFVVSGQKSNKDNLDRHSLDFVRMAGKYFEANHIDIRRFLHPNGNEKTETGYYVLNDQDNSHSGLDSFQTPELLQPSYYEAVLDLLDANVTVQLYDVLADPTESVDIADSNGPVVDLMLARLYEELPRYVPQDQPSSTMRGAPENFNNTYSPGWC